MNIKIGLSIFLDDIATKGDADTIRKEIRNREYEIEKENNMDW